MQIEIDEISKEFGTTAALTPVSLSIPSGALVALLGPMALVIPGWRMAVCRRLPCMRRLVA